MKKNFINYKLVTDVKDEELTDEAVNRINDSAKVNTGVWSPEYGLHRFGLLETNGIDYVAVEGEIIAKTKKECYGLLSGLKSVLKHDLGNCKKVEDRLVMSGDRFI